MINFMGKLILLI